MNAQKRNGAGGPATALGGCPLEGDLGRGIDQTHATSSDQFPQQVVRMVRVGCLPRRRSCSHPRCNTPSISALVWRKGKVIDLGPLPSPDSVPYGINNQGQVMGDSYDETGLHAW